MNQFEDVIYPNEISHVTTNVDYIEEDKNNENNENYLNLVQILRELVDNNLKEEIEFKSMVGGVTNTLYKSSFITGQGNNKSVIIRLYGKGSDQFIDRKTEANIQYLLSKNGVGPKFYGTFENGCIYGYVEGDQLQLEDLYNRNILKLISQETGKWHTLELDLPSRKENIASNTSLFSNINLWMENAIQLVKSAPTSSPISEINIEHYRDEALYLMGFLEKHYGGDNLNKHVNFCHNDLIPRNMIYDQEKNQVKFIDFEYSGYNFRGYDIGNFFCEFSGLDLDYTKYPSIEIQKRFIKDYLISVNSFKQNKLNNNSKSNVYEPTEKEIHSLYIEANHFSLGSHLMWAFWSIIQFFNSSIDFDYLDYTKKRFAQYTLVKEKVLLLK
ncbi:hypothetical protein DICPUDRAFT_85862 [Dictyostelium purpureum]|uniref:ethanolamine kinase n=1 Tax=Dictyostelium purpureum TaxID=5786 RepID=F0Z7T7_DICPU|nr:uncharacterized protein DICPUDRAFT_85862 [Dictyostelium purpureum]EGC40001.1 hypothetical protein DICPUDRAFT_85862 [Dictyostelium purpureum]|eukprot:XP_003283504.1 hypothetical protein DICPUDRAFT_85862 [Dictyostelium purpureum]